MNFWTAIKKSQDFIGEEKLDYAHCVLKKGRFDNLSNLFLYHYTRSLLTGSNLCEQFSSKAEYVVGYRLLAIDPTNLKEYLFLHVNAQKIGIMDIQTVINPKDSTN